MDIPHASLLDGSATAAAIKDELRTRVARLDASGSTPTLGTLMVGDDEASASYIQLKHRDCAEVGVEATGIELPASASQEEIASAVDRLNADASVTAFIVQLPLPKGIDEERVLERIDPEKDADGLHPLNLGRLVLGADPTTTVAAPMPVTPLGVLELLQRHGVDPSGGVVVVIGDGPTVARPLALMFARRGLDTTVVLAAPDAAGLANEVRRGDIVVSAVGRPGLVRAEWIKPGAVIVDVGMTNVGTTESGATQLEGDVVDEAAEAAAWLSTTPGGMGPMTRVMLVANVVAVAERQAGLAHPDPAPWRVGDDLADDAAAGARE